MWDVKRGYESLYGPSRVEFYLNYVGCKVKKFPNIAPKILRFTLTMWDVKYLFIYHLACCTFRFTLTMWDVKLVL